ncbi:hypothetical protein ACH3PA_06945 [Leeuwenhoekiella sp. A2]|uniref:hypothetical protein n=2 Tax=unclassified Leeuwenhoekiella TaxID=2615029 RepID=UPI003A80B537
MKLDWCSNWNGKKRTPIIKKGCAMSNDYIILSQNTAYVGFECPMTNNYNNPYLRVETESLVDLARSQKPELEQGFE